MDRRVTIPDMVARTGLPLGVVSTALNDLAFELKADLDVTNTGQIFYQFPGDLHYRYYSNRVLEILNRIWMALAPVLEFIFRISFGIVLLVSITIVFLIMLVLQALMCAFSGNTNEVLNLIKEFFSLIKRLRIFDPQAWKRRDLAAIEPDAETDNKDRGFLLNCYALLFGPEDPNRNFEREKSKAVAQLIRVNNGIILPEELAPLTGAAADELEGAFPVLAKFHGVPGATPSGHLVYKFPEMQEARLGTGDPALPTLVEDEIYDINVNPDDQPPNSVKMHPCVFTDISVDSMKPIILLAVSNFLGTVFFWTMLFAVHSSDSTGANFFLVLALYASFFLFFPAARWIRVYFKNRRIKRYNEKIDQLETELAQPPAELTTAFREVQKLRQEELSQLTDQLAYTTRKDYLEQETDHLYENPSQSDKPAV